MVPLKKIFRLSVAVWFGLLSPVWASKPAEGEIVTIRVQGAPNAANTDPASIAEQKVVAAFREKYPNVRVVSAEGLKIQSMNPEATTIMMIAGGIAPDVIRMQFRSSDSFIQQGIVEPLDEYIARAPNGKELLDKFNPKILPVIRRKGPDGQVHVWGLPTQLLVSALFYNRELFQRAGLPDRAPETWEELLEFGRTLRDFDRRITPLHLLTGINGSFYLMNFVRSAGGDSLTEIPPGSDEWRATFNNKAFVDAFAFYYQLVDEKIGIRNGKAPALDELKNVGMMFRYVGDTLTIDPELWGFGPIPKGPAGLHGAEINAGILGIYSGIQDPRVKQAAFDYINFVTSEEADRIRTQTLVELGQANVLNPVSLRKFGYEEYLIMTPPGFEEKFQNGLRDGRPESYGRNCNLIYNEMTYPLDQMLLSRSVRNAWLAGDMEVFRNEIQALLAKAEKKTNERLIGYVSPEEMKKRRIVASVVVLIIAAAFVWVARYLIRHFTHASAMISRPLAGKSIAPWLCLFPAIALVLIWNYIPLVRGTQMAFLDYKIILPSIFVGLDNFANVLYDSAFWNSLLATFHYAAWTLTLGFVTPIVLAYGLHLIPKHKILFRTLYYMPAVISGTAVYFLWKELFNTDGILNTILRSFGFQMERAWTDDPHLAMLACVIPGVWAGAGPGCLIYLAALKGVPEEQFEAAEIDGASLWAKTRHIVFPALKSLIVINFVGAVAAAFHGATNILIMTGGGPNGATEVSSLLIFLEAFSRLRFGPATAMAWIIGSLLLGFTVFQLKRLSQMEFKANK